MGRQKKVLKKDGRQRGEWLFLKLADYEEKNKRFTNVNF